MIPRLPVLTGVIVLGTALTSMAGSDKAMKIIGLWEVAKSEGAPPGATIEFMKDGKFKMVARSINVSIDGTYKVNDDKISISFTANGKSKESTATISKLTDKELHLADQKGKTDEYKRVK